MPCFTTEMFDATWWSIDRLDNGVFKARMKFALGVAESVDDLRYICFRILQEGKRLRKNK